MEVIRCLLACFPAWCSLFFDLTALSSVRVTAKQETFTLHDIHGHDRPLILHVCEVFLGDLILWPYFWPRIKVWALKPRQLQSAEISCFTVVAAIGVFTHIENCILNNSWDFWCKEFALWCIMSAGFWTVFHAQSSAQRGFKVELWSQTLKK